MEQGLAAITTQTSKIKVLKHNIVTHVKGLGWSEHDAPWSANGEQYSIQCLKECLMCAISDSSAKNNQAQAPVMSL